MPERSSNRTTTGSSRGPSYISCERCRKRKVKCDRARPCMQCRLAKVECTSSDSVRKRPVSRSYAEALEEKIMSLETFIASLASASHIERDRMLLNFQQSRTNSLSRSVSEPEEPGYHCPPKGRLVRMKEGIATQLYGETSFYPIVTSLDEGVDEDLRPSPSLPIVPVKESYLLVQTSGLEQSSDIDSEFTPHSPACRNLISLFFQHFYYYHMVLYREYFLRDYKTGKGQYYSDLLLYAILAIGALSSQDNSAQNLSEIFYKRAEKLLYSGALDSPNITTIQALLLLGQFDVGRGQNTKGWLLTGIAFRLVSEMGLHIDPNHWKTGHDSEVDREVLRRVYWSCFIADKQLALYFGRPPALHSSEADVQNSIRIAYPVDWDVLLDEYIKKDISRTEYEDGVAFTSCFTQLANLSKIVHRMITEVFENRQNTESSILAASIKSVHVDLIKWLNDLPAKLRWNQWLKDSIPPYVLQLHIFYQTVLIILFRPPRKLMSGYLPDFREGFEICDQSLSIITQILTTYSREWGLQHLPMTMVHTVASAASFVLLKLRVQGSSSETLRQLDLVSNVVDNMAKTWKSAVHIQNAINNFRQEIVQNDALDESAFLNLEDPMTLNWYVHH
ncbi:fungal-specific transcription factor domain-containing protein [Talaromyces proteolyticus]|uniref:Fungal-specific transcription factor domain-containing protein n=1 Tax=Talaromyces proteolyticus TaxID=1131652 RepID=A0AAD4KR91_9EURO|nr:fungal-specific transcription factor domain-containing protein [Talaromyces proteolyticus]KAH8694274.1 fungal-specific transcription factor domain-containing protein [Talaromyces proteolyticus]